MTPTAWRRHSFTVQALPEYETQTWNPILAALADHGRADPADHAAFRIDWPRFLRRQTRRDRRLTSLLGRDEKAVKVANGTGAARRDFKPLSSLKPANRATFVGGNNCTARFVLDLAAACRHNKREPARVLNVENYTMTVIPRSWRRRLPRARIVPIRPTFRPGLEILEDRLAPAVITVLTNGDATGALTPVNGGFTAPTLRAAIDGANGLGGANTIDFSASVAGQTITLTTNDTKNPFAFGPTALVIGLSPGTPDNLTIQGDPTFGVIISGNNARRIFGVFAGSLLTLDDVTLTGGKAIGGNGGGGGPSGGGGAGLGGAIFNDGTLNVLQSTLTGNTAVGGSGNIVALGCVACGGGGGAAGYAGGGVSGGGLDGGGGGGVRGMGGNGSGGTGGSGGAPESGLPAIPNANGTSGGGGGGASYGSNGIGGSGSSLSSGGFGGGGGGGGPNSGNSVNDGGNGGFGGGGGGGEVSGGNGGFGGGGGTGYFSSAASGGYGAGSGINSSAGGGGGGGMGGGIFNNGGTVTITDSTLFGNSATGGSGVNAGKGLGGGVFNLNGTLTILNSTLSGNTAAQGGGGIFNLGSTTSGSGYSTGTGTVNMSNTIVANSAGSVTDFSGSGTQAFGAANATNLIYNNSGFVGTGTITGTNPQLSALGSFSGPTQTLALLPGSPAINAGSNAQAAGLTTDQRGFNRVVNGTVDIGAFEFQPAASVTLTSSLTPAAVGQGVTFTATLGGLVPGSNTPTGSVTFLADGTTLGSAMLNGTTATFTTSSLTAGTHTIVAVYNTAPFPQSQSAPLSEVITTPPPPPPPSSSTTFVVGADAGGLPQVNVYDAKTGTLKASFFAWPSFFTGGVTVAVGDVTGDGVPDIVVGAGPGGLPEVKVYDGVSYQLVRDFFAFSAFFSGGVYVAAGDINKDGFADVVVGAGPGGLSQVNVYSGKDGSVLSQFFAFPGFFSGGVRVAAGDVNGDGRADIIAAAGPGGLAQVNVYDGATFNLLSSFFAYPNYVGGAFVAAGDVNGDGKAEVITGPSGNLTPQVILFDGNTGAPINLFLAYSTTFQGGVRVGYAAAFGSSGKPAILTAAGPSGGPEVSAFDASSLAALNSFFALPQGFSGGLFVGG